MQSSETCKSFNKASASQKDSHNPLNFGEARVLHIAPILGWAEAVRVHFLGTSLTLNSRNRDLRHSSRDSTMTLNGANVQYNYARCSFTPSTQVKPKVTLNGGQSDVSIQ